RRSARSSTVIHVLCDYTAPVAIYTLSLHDALPIFAVAGHGDGLARHGDEAGGTGGQALDGDVDGRRVVAQRVENGDAVEHVPTRAIETQVDVLGGQVGQLAHEVLGGDAPIADLVVDQQIHRVLGDVLEGVPVGASLPELRDGP